MLGPARDAACVNTFAFAYQLISADCLARVSSELSEFVTGDFDRK